jgi:PAS domain S-box-containing protein
LDDPRSPSDRVLNGFTPLSLQALERLPVAMYLADRSGILRWLNRAGRNLVGDMTGKGFPQVIAPERRHETREQFARKVIGAAEATSFETTLVSPEGDRIPVELASVPLRDKHDVVAVLGVALVRDEPRTATPKRPPPELTPRGHEVLRLLADGRTTLEICEELGIALETARNHIRGVLRALGVKTRLEAVVLALRNGWL